MEILVIIVGVVGSFASIIGAVLSIKAESNAKTHAETAESIKNEILARQKTTELAEILYESKKIQKSFVKYSTAQTQSALSGVSFEKDAQELRDFISKINENRALLEKTAEIKAAEVYKSLNSLLDEYCSNNTIQNKREKGKLIVRNIDEIIFKLRKSIDNRNEK